MKNRSLTLISIFLCCVILFSFTKDEWLDICPVGSRCCVKMLSQPKEVNKIVVSPYGELNLKINMCQPKLGTDDNLAYGLSYSDYPKGTIHSEETKDLKSFFDSSRDGAVAAVQGKLLKEEILNFNGYPGREYVVEALNIKCVIKYRHYLVKNRLYTLQVITPTTNNFNLSINKFLDSFKLK